MNYKDYQNSRDLSWKILLQERVSELPVKISRLCRQMGIEVYQYTPNDDNDGYCTIIGGKPRIYISDRCLPQRQRFSCAHELGHILLGHVNEEELVNREPDPKDNPIEQAANVFAARILAPACVLWALDARTPKEIAALCDISHQSAKFRAERMELLYKRGMFLSHPLERAVYQQFTGFIQKRKG